MIGVIFTLLKESKSFRLGVYIVLSVFLVIFAWQYIHGKVIENYTAKAGTELRERVHDAVRAGDDVLRDPSRLRENDGHRRD